jgi:uncharacterized glyoxalase superfamily protein PhnB
LPRPGARHRRRRPHPGGHCSRAKRAGAEDTRELVATDYRSHEYAARDLEGILWSFGTYNPHDR